MEFGRWTEFDSARGSTYTVRIQRKVDVMMLNEMCFSNTLSKMRYALRHDDFETIVVT